MFQLPSEPGHGAVAAANLRRVEQNALFPVLVVGELVEIVAFHHLAAGGSLRFQQGKGAGDLDGFGNRAHVELHFDIQVLADAEGKPVAYLLLESGGGDRNLIRSVDQRRYTEQTVRVGGADGVHVGLGLRDRDLSVRYHRSARDP